MTKRLDFSRFLNCSEEILSFGVPSLEVIIRTAIEFASYSCHICEPMDKDKDKDKAGKEEKKTGAGPSPTVWVTTGSKVAPQNSQQVNKQHLLN